MQKIFNLFPFLVFVLLFSACSSSTSGDGDNGDDPNDPNADTSQSLFFVLDEIIFPTGGEVFGFDLDGEGASVASCNKEDLAGNVDNQLGSVLQGLPVVDDDTLTLADTLNDSVVDFIADGTLLAAGEISGIDDFQNDSYVRLDIYALRVPEGKTAPDVDANGVLLADQTFDIDPSSLNAGAPVMRFDNLAIIDGQIDSGPAESAESAVILLRAPLGAHLYELRLTWARIAFDLTETRITNGMIGGVADVSTFGSQLECSGAVQVASIDDTLGLVADFSNSGDATNKNCQGVSMGVSFKGIPVVKGGVGLPADVGACAAN
ncbi:MAG: hypothetical protein IPJ88_07495 [Myxococcales bacterium]|nr:MAG: hypothetical protein IPJ88_07495 [Myxococcales bacterium]